MLLSECFISWRYESLFAYQNTIFISKKKKFLFDFKTDSVYFSENRLRPIKKKHTNTQTDSSDLKIWTTKSSGVVLLVIHYQLRSLEDLLYSFYFPTYVAILPVSDIRNSTSNDN